MPYDQSHVKKLAANKQIGVFFGNDSDHIFGNLPLRDSKNYRAVSDVREDLYGKIVYIKNVWSDIGKSSTCNFNWNDYNVFLGLFFINVLTFICLI